MTIFLAIAQRKILRSPGLTAPFLRFCCFKFTDIDTRKYLTLHFIKKKQFTTET